MKAPTAVQWHVIIGAVVVAAGIYVVLWLIATIMGAMYAWMELG